MVVAYNHIDLPLFVHSFDNKSIMEKIRCYAYAHYYGYRFDYGNGYTSTITENLTSDFCFETIRYSVDNQRIRSQYYENNQLQKTKYFAANYEKEITPAKTREINYISTPYGVLAAYIKESGAGQMYYLYKDHLGSITTIINQSGTDVERRSFDAWGRPRHPDNWNYVNIPAMTILERGYTGHEHLETFGLINMNGRMYDPIIGRMLSPDPYVQGIAGTQGYNRYSYCLNNPLKYTDPSGESAILLGAVIGAFIACVSTAISDMHSGTMTSGWQMLGHFAVGAVSGALGGAIGGGAVGVLEGAIYGAMAGAASGFVGGAGNAWVRGASSSEIFRQGFRGAAWGAAFGAVAGGIGGGITAKRHGGNLWTGKGATYDFVLPPTTESTVTVGADMEYSTKYAKTFSDEYFGKIENVDNLYADGSIPKGYTKRGDLVFNEKGQLAGGSTVYNGIGKGSDVFLYKTAFTSKEKLYLVMGHEYIHVNFNANGYARSIRAQERAAYKWNIDQAKAWKMSTTPYEKMYNSYWMKNMYPVLDYKQANFFILNQRPW